MGTVINYFIITLIDDTIGNETEKKLLQKNDVLSHFEFFYGWHYFAFFKFVF